MKDLREILKQKKRVVIKVGTTTVTYPNTGYINLEKLERFVRVLINMRNKGMEVIVVSSGAVGVGRQAIGMKRKPETDAEKQACAAVGQGRLMMIYEKLFNEYSQLTAQVLLTRESVYNEQCRKMVHRTFEQLLRMKVVPIVNENDVISMDELAYGVIGDNDTLAAYVTELVGADLLIMMSDIDGLYTDDPNKNQSARFIHTVAKIDENLEHMAKGSSTDLGTGGMETKINAAKIATSAGADMVIANGKSIYTINDIVNGKKIGTLFLAKEHANGVENEISSERPQYRRAAKRAKKSGTCKKQQ